MQTEYVTFIVDFKIHGRLAFLSHQETLSLWRRILVRAQVPLIFSQGFNPHPRLSLALPRTVGVQSDCERLCALVAADGFCAKAAKESLESLLPSGCTLSAADQVAGKASFYPISVTYQFVLDQPADCHRKAHFEKCLRQIQSRCPIFLERRTEKQKTRTLDMGPFLECLTPAETDVKVQCAVRPEGTVRVDELMRWLELEPADLAQMPRRIAVEWVSQAKQWHGEGNLS
jgi:radical SAM-linked protein